MSILYVFIYVYIYIRIYIYKYIYIHIIQRFYRSGRSPNVLFWGLVSSEFLQFFLGVYLGFLSYAV